MMARSLALAALALVVAAAPRAAATSPGEAAPHGTSHASSSAAPSVDDDAALRDLMARLKAVPGIYARFTEERTIGLLARPIVNRGTLRFDPPGKLLRTVDEPHESRVLLVGDEIWVREGGPYERIDLGKHPTARAFVRSFRNLLSGDREALAQHFVLNLRSGEGEAWELELTPRSKDMRAIVKKMRVSGHREIVERLVVEEPSGDVSDTRFHDVDAHHPYSAAASARWFRPPT